MGRVPWEGQSLSEQRRASTLASAMLLPLGGGRVPSQASGAARSQSGAGRSWPGSLLRPGRGSVATVPRWVGMGGAAPSRNPPHAGAVQGLEQEP